MGPKLTLLYLLLLHTNHHSRVQTQILTTPMWNHGTRKHTELLECRYRTNNESSTFGKTGHPRTYHWWQLAQTSHQSYMPMSDSHDHRSLAKLPPLRVEDWHILRQSKMDMGGIIIWEIFQPCLITPEGTRLDSEDSRQALLLFSASGKSSLAASCNLGVLMLWMIGTKRDRTSFLQWGCKSSLDKQ